MRNTLALRILKITEIATDARVDDWKIVIRTTGATAQSA